MNKNKWILISVIALAALVGAVTVGKGLWGGAGAASQNALYFCPMHPTYTSDRPGTCPICNMSLVKREADQDPAEVMDQHSATAHDHTAPASVPQEAYACPMHPEIVSDVPADCSICGMHLVKNEAAEKNVVREFTVAQLMAMKPGEICVLHKCKMGKCMMKMTEENARMGKCPHCNEDLGVTIKNEPPDGYAKVKLGAAQQEMVGMKTAPVKNMEMSKVIRTVGRIAYDPELYQAQEEYLQAVQAYQKAEASGVPEIKEQSAKLIDSAKIKLRLIGLNDELIQEIEKLGKPDRSLLYSDAGGTVWLYAPIYEYEMSLVKPGDAIEVEVAAVPGKKIPGVIRAIDSVLDPMTRSVKVRAVLNNPEGLLKPEMYATASIAVGSGNKLAVPEEAVFATGEKNIIFVASAGGTFEPREVVLGMRSEDYVEIRSGVGEGEQVVISGNFLIDSESRLKAAFENMGSQGGHQHGN